MKLRQPFTYQELENSLNRKQRQRVMRVAVRSAKWFEMELPPVKHPPGSFGEILSQ